MLDDLAAFNDEELVRAIAASRVPTLVGVGHEADVTLADMVADVRAATPSNAAQILVPDKAEIIRAVKVKAGGAGVQLVNRINDQLRHTDEQLCAMFDRFDDRVGETETALRQLQRILTHVDPRAVLQRGYAIMRGHPEVGGSITVETQQALIKAKVTEYTAYDKK